jgi:hypothetical protein
MRIPPAAALTVSGGVVGVSDPSTAQADCFASCASQGLGANMNFGLTQTPNGQILCLCSRAAVAADIAAPSLATGNVTNMMYSAPAV